MNRIVHNIGLNVHKNADLPAGMDIGLNEAILLVHLPEAADVHVLSDDGDHAGELLLHGEGGIARPGLCKESLEICRAGGECLLCDLCDIVAELLVLCDKIGLCIDLNDNRVVSALGDKRLYHTLSRDSSGLLLCAGQSLLAKEVDRLLHISLGRRKSLLAVHHSGAGCLSEFLYHCCCYCHFVFSLSLA